MIEDMKIAESAWIAAQKLAKKLIVPDADVLTITEQIEAEINDIAACAFPLNISFNNQAAHFTPCSDTTHKINDNDVIKVDIGTQHNGYVVDAAFTIDLSKKYSRLLESTESAVNSAVNYIKKNKTDSEIGALGECIENEIKSRGYKPIVNLTGHSISRYNIHAGQSILNYKTDLRTKLQQGTYAIEPFATTGSGKVHNGEFCGIYFYEGGNSRNNSARKLISEIMPYNGLPFAERWIGKDMDLFTKKMAMSQLIREGIIRPAPVLEDIKGSIVSQHEKTVVITESEVFVYPK